MKLNDKRQFNFIETSIERNGTWRKTNTYEQLQTCCVFLWNNSRMHPHDAMPPNDEAVVVAEVVVEVNTILQHPGEPKDAAWLRQHQRLVLRSSDWEYMAEGGRHVLFSYAPSSSDDATPLWDPKRKDNRHHHHHHQQQEEAISLEPHPHWLMRWNKHDLMQAASLFQSGSVLLEQDARTRTTSSKSSRNSTTNSTSLLDHVRDLVVPALSPYVDVPVHSWTWTLVAATESSSLPSQRSSVKPWCALAHALYTQAVTSGKIPAHRQRPGEWTLFQKQGRGNEPSNQPERTVTVELWYDYRRPLWSSTNLCHTTPKNSSLFTMSSCSTFWSVELKPKAGYRPYSPLIHPHHRIKYTASRFQLLQRQKQQQQQQPQQPQGSTSTRAPPPATTTTTTNGSRYDPQKLFSNNRAQIRQALDDLRDCPGNNLRMWRGGTPTNNTRSNKNRENHSGAKDTPHALPLPLAPREEDATPPHTPEDDDDHVSRVLAIVAEILVREPWLSKLLTLQELDWIDADGAILLYRHLLSLLATPSLDDLLEEDVSAAVERYAQQLINQLVAGDRNSDPGWFPETTTHTSHPNVAQSLSSSSFVPPPNDSSCWLEHNPPKLVKHCPIPFPHHLQQQQHRPPLDSSSKSSSTTETHGTRALHALLCLIQDLYDNDKSRQPSQQQRDPKVLDQAYAKCLEWIGQLGVAETVYLLQVWLFSLAMCDVSCFVRLHMFPATATAAAATHCSNDDDDDASGFRLDGLPAHESLQTNERPGWLYYAPPPTRNGKAPNDQKPSTSTTRHNDNHHQGWWIAYSIKAIDCDAKPAHKLATRQSKEDLFKGLG